MLQDNSAAILNQINRNKVKALTAVGKRKELLTIDWVLKLGDIILK